MRIHRPVYSTAAAPLQEREGVTARVDSVIFSPALDAPPDRPFAFVYRVTICNASALEITLKARKWVVKETASRRCHVVEGDGVAGRFPKIARGENFSFENYHVIAADSIAEGSLLACDETGHRLVVRVPAFAMTITG